MGTLFRNKASEPNIVKSIPTTKHMAKALILLDQLNVTVESIFYIRLNIGNLGMKVVHEMKDERSNKIMSDLGENLTLKIPVELSSS